MTAQLGFFLVTVASLCYQLQLSTRGHLRLSGKCTTRDLENLSLSCTESFGFFHGSVLGQDTSEFQPSPVGIQEIHEYVKCRHHRLKAASIKCNFINHKSVNLLKDKVFFT